MKLVSAMLLLSCATPAPSCKPSHAWLGASNVCAGEAEDYCSRGPVPRAEWVALCGQYVHPFDGGTP